MKKASKMEQHWRFWLCVGVGTILIVWLTSSVLLPFVAGLATAYLFDPLVDRLQRLKISRTWATVIVLFLFIAVLVMTILLIAPLFVNQLVSLIESIPAYIQEFRDHSLPLIYTYLEKLSPEDAERLRTAATNFTGTAVSWAGSVATGIVSGGMALLDIFALVFITPIVAFYLLRDWDHIVHRIDHYLPRTYAGIIRAETAEIDRTLSGFVRGQILVCVILGLFYAIALSLAGLPFGLTIGLIAGILSFIPYVGSLVGFLSSVGVAFFQFDDYGRVLIVAAIFFFGQAVEGNFLTPKLVGQRVGLHPVWVIFALLVGGNLFGFLGVLVAVPVAAVVGVLMRFALERYTHSVYYQPPLKEEPSVPMPLSPSHD